MEDRHKLAASHDDRRRSARKYTPFFDFTFALDPLHFTLNNLTDELSATIGTNQIINPFGKAVRQTNDSCFHAKWWSSHGDVVTARRALSITSFLTDIGYCGITIICAITDIG